jgi:dihydroneopterin aldolase
MSEEHPQMPDPEDVAPESEDEHAFDEDDEEREESTVSIDVTGLNVYTHHGVSAAEREVGQRLLIDVSFDLDQCDALVTDDIADTVDYGVVCQQVWLVAQERSYKTLERLCNAIADHLLDNFRTDSVTVRATKPEPPIPLPVDGVSVEVWKGRS